MHKWIADRDRRGPDEWDLYTRSWEVDLELGRRGAAAGLFAVTVMAQREGGRVTGWAPQSIQPLSRGPISAAPQPRRSAARRRARTSSSRIPVPPPSVVSLSIRCGLR